ncbi:hypothetical protein FQA39_LY02439 [Lamprigera yunnana]|nr:hypothetical protein FQA39_LY02439 [Lamprigera yunnana]
MSKIVQVCRLGKISYLDGIKIQNILVKNHRCNTTTTANTLLLLEHPPVYTIGIRTKDYTVEEEKKLIKTGAEFYRTNRGGLITFHGPGQLVVYPILNLKHFQASMRWYVSQLETTVINLCEHFGLKAQTSPHTGVWIGDNKVVCAIGVHGSRFITSHGIALNCNTNLDWYEHIIPCGIEDKGVTSLTEEVGRNISVEEIIPIFIKSFGTVFDCNHIYLEKDEINKLLQKL